jgi:hypothetical protein
VNKENEVILLAARSTRRASFETKKSLQEAATASFSLSLISRQFEKSWLEYFGGSLLGKKSTPEHNILLLVVENGNWSPIIAFHNIYNHLTQKIIIDI